MPTMRVNDIDLYYEVHGAGEPLVLIMGLRRNAQWWYRQIPALFRRFRVIAFDNRGAGRSDKPVMDYSMGLFAEDTAGLMRALGLDRAHVLGLSMGGYIAQELAINHPRLVRRLVLGCTGPGGRRAVAMSPDRLDKFKANEGLTPARILGKDMDIYFSDGFIANNPALIEEFVDISLRHYQPQDAFVRQFEACLRHDTVDRLGSVEAPTLIMSGDDDPLVPHQNSLALEELLPQARLRLYPGGRHCFFIERAEDFNRAVIDFLSDGGGPRVGG
ncbi:MAG: alpha/beta hydrolase [Proteobacteria bacterium]|nr:alpha/beta hydrolase [Pseudomonadota bacterium]